MERRYGKFARSAPPALLLYEASQGRVRLPSFSASSPSFYMSTGQRSNILAEDAPARANEDVLVLTLRLLLLSYFRAFIYTDPCCLQRYFQIEAPQLILIGQSQKLIGGELSGNISPGQVPSTGGRYSKKAGEERRRGKRQEIHSHVPGGAHGLVPWAHRAWCLWCPKINISLSPGSGWRACGVGRWTPSDSVSRIDLVCWIQPPSLLALSSLVSLFRIDSFK